MVALQLPLFAARLERCRALRGVYVCCGKYAGASRNRVDFRRRRRGGGRLNRRPRDLCPAFNIEIFVDTRADLAWFARWRASFAKHRSVIDGIRKRDSATDSSYYFQPRCYLFSPFSPHSPRAITRVCMCPYVSSARLWPTTSAIASAMIVGWTPTSWLTRMSKCPSA